MKIILLQDVKKLGKKGEIIEANDGYARNYIIPQKLGVEATGKNLNDLKLQKNNQEKVALEQLSAAKQLAEDIATKQVVVKIKAGEGGKVFGSISSKVSELKKLSAVPPLAKAPFGCRSKSPIIPLPTISL